MRDSLCVVSLLGPVQRPWNMVVAVTLTFDSSTLNTCSFCLASDSFGSNPFGDLRAIKFTRFRWSSLRDPDLLDPHTTSSQAQSGNISLRFTGLLTSLLTYLLTHLFTFNLLIYLLTCSLTSYFLFAYLHTYWLTYLFTYSLTSYFLFTYLLTYRLTYLLTHSLTSYLLTYLIAYLLTYLLT